MSRLNLRHLHMGCGEPLRTQRIPSCRKRQDEAQDRNETGHDKNRQHKNGKGKEA